MSTNIEPSAILADFGVNLGDHGETKRYAVEITRDTTVGELIDRHLRADFNPWAAEGVSQASTSKWLEIRGIVRSEPKETN